MGFRFRRSVRLFPGVRLNFSGGGISTTIGVRGASVNLGRHGAYATVGIPGSGLSYRTRISPSHGRESHPVVVPVLPATAQQPLIPFEQPSVLPTHQEGEIVSAPIEVLTSAGLGEIKRLINEARVQQIALRSEVSAATAHLSSAEAKLRFAETIVVRIFYQRQIPTLARSVYDTNLTLNAAQDQLEGCVVDVDFDFDDVTLAKYSALLRCYELLRNSARLWDITASVAIDRKKERSAASQAITRQDVRFGFSNSDLVTTKYQALRLANVNGQDVHIYPGFVMMRNDSQDFALIDVRDLSVIYADSRFIEEQPLPPDAETVGQAWKRSNKDGSPDRRFNDNYQIPILRYGDLSFTSPTGLLEVYQVSNWQNARNFATAFADFQRALAANAKAPQQVSLPPPASEVLEVAAETAPAFEPPAPKSLIADWMVLGFLALLLACAGIMAPTWIGNIRAAPAQAAFPTVQALSPAPITAAARPTQDLVFLIGSVANIRSVPSAHASIVAKARSDHPYTVFDHRKGWTEIGDESPIGWIRSTLVRSASD